MCATLGDVALHERLVDRFRHAENPQDRERVLLSLSRLGPGGAGRTWS